MYIYQYALIIGFTCLLFNRGTKGAAGVFLVGWALYLFFILDAPSSYKYICCATIETVIAFILNAKYRLVSYIGYSLTIVNVYGLFLIGTGRMPITYDVIYAVLAVTQFLLLLARAMPNGINRLHPKSFVVRVVNFDSRQACNRVHKKLKTQGSN
jgi:hypothetical protein